MEKYEDKSQSQSHSQSNKHYDIIYPSDNLEHSPYEEREHMSLYDQHEHEPNVEMISQGKLDAFVNGQKVIDSEYSANLNDGILSLETTTNGENDIQVVDLNELLEENSRKESLKNILRSLLQESRVKEGIEYANM